MSHSTAYSTYHLVEGMSALGLDLDLEKCQPSQCLNVSSFLREIRNPSTYGRK